MYLRRPRMLRDKESLLTPVDESMHNLSQNNLIFSENGFSVDLFHMRRNCDCVSYKKFVVKCPPYGSFVVLFWKPAV